MRVTRHELGNFLGDAEEAAIFCSDACDGVSWLEVLDMPLE
jgi:hypothetical protein